MSAERDARESWRTEPSTNLVRLQGSELNSCGEVD